MTEAKSITNIYYDCLERIFDFLDLESLLNVAGTCKRLQIAAAANFGDKYRDRNICLNLCKGNGIVGNVSNIDDSRNELIAVQREVCLPFLRCFGAKITDLDLLHQNDSPDSKLDTVQQYVNQYCADTLTTIGFDGNLSFSNGIFQKPFKNVDLVFIHDNDLKDQLPNFVNWFPNMLELHMNGVTVDKNSTEASFPLLEHIALDIEDKFTNEYAAKLLRVNKQLESLTIWTHGGITMSNLLDMISGNTALSMLSVSLLGYTAVNVTKAELNRLANEHLMMIDLDLLGYCLSADDVIAFLGQVDSLESFGFQVNDRSEFDRLSSELANEWRINVDLGDNGEQHIELSKWQS